MHPLRLDPEPYFAEIGAALAARGALMDDFERDPD